MHRRRSLLNPGAHLRVGERTSSAKNVNVNRRAQSYVSVSAKNPSYPIRERDDAEVYSNTFAVAVESHHRHQVRFIHRNEPIPEQLAISSIPGQ